MKPQLDHYYGRSVLKVVVIEDDDWDWTIFLEGGVAIRNLDKHRTAPTAVPEIDALPFDSHEEKGNQIDLYFGPQKVTVKKDEMELSDMNYDKSKDDEGEALLPPDPSDERIATGPTGEPDASQKEAE